jgi:hypothetical protein
VNIQRFCSKLESTPSHDVLQYERDFVELIPALDLEGLLLSELRQCQADHRRPPNVRSGLSVVLHRGSWFVLELMALENPTFSAEVTTEASDALYHFLTPLSLRKYELRHFDGSHYSDQARAVLVEEGTVAAGSTLAVDSGRHALAMCSGSPMVFLSLSPTKKNLYCWDFHSARGTPIQHYHNRSIATAMQLMARLMGCYGDEHCAPALERLLSHDSDSVKWQAATALLQIDAARGFAAMATLSQSGNPALRKAACETLKIGKETV